MRTAVRLLCIAAAAAAATASAQVGQGFAPPADRAPWDKVQGRLSLSAAPTTPFRAEQPGTVDALSLRSLSLIGDYYLTGALFGERQAGGLRATSALLVGPRSLSLGAGALGLPGNGRGLSVERRLQPYTGESDSGALPYLGIGYTAFSSRGGFGWSADLGFVGLSAGSAVRFGRAPASLDDAVRELRLSPMLQLGVTYSF